MTVGQLTVAIIYDSIHDTYHVFDSHSRAAFGNPSSNGASVLLNFRNLEELCIYIQRIHVNQLFNLTPVLITDELQSQFNFAPSIGKYIVTGQLQINHTYSLSSGDMNHRHSHEKMFTNTMCVYLTMYCLGQVLGMMRALQLFDYRRS